jgi:rhodanese-related sulfurtransferase
MNRIWLLPALALALALAAPAQAKDEPFQLVSVDEVTKLLGQPGVAILDANPRDVFDAGRLPGAVFVEDPLAARLPKDKNAKLVFYCKNPK